mmetsp:Transcript_24288/g.72369  ORF Transcript_24288/g.72369 Transcript_24288/m.72369 type:complete len:265 (+) Transcript_24288:5305-6099(+)
MLLVVVSLLLLADARELVHRSHLLVDGRVDPRRKKVAVDERARRVHHLVVHQLQVLLHLVLGLVEKPRAILVVDEAVAENALALVRPQPREILPAGGPALVRHQHALDHLRNLAQVEGVVGLGGHGPEHVARLVVEPDRRLHQWSAEGRQLARQRVLEEGLRDGREDGLNYVGRHGREVEHVQVAEHPVRHHLPTPARRAHGRDERQVSDGLPFERLAVVPAAAKGRRARGRVGGRVDQLPHQLDGRLRAVGLALGHVEVVDEY